jgi:hypothetical protein
MSLKIVESLLYIICSAVWFSDYMELLDGCSLFRRTK